jgi:hypothetical protein
MSNQALALAWCLVIYGVVAVDQGLPLALNITLHHRHPAMTLAVITSVPNYVSEEQHRELVSSTPSSFSEIPPVLCYREENISVVLDPPLQGFSEEDGATGTLYLLSS